MYPIVTDMHFLSRYILKQMSCVTD